MFEGFGNKFEVVYETATVSSGRSSKRLNRQHKMRNHVILENTRDGVFNIKRAALLRPLHTRLRVNGRRKQISNADVH